MKINDVVALFDETYSSLIGSSNNDYDDSFSTVLLQFCASIGLSNWDLFKNSSRKKEFYSKALDKKVLLVGDTLHPKPEKSYSASEIEIIFRHRIDLKKVDRLKEVFDASVINISSECV